MKQNEIDRATGLCQAILEFFVLTGQVLTAIIDDDRSDRLREIQQVRRD